MKKKKKKEFIIQGFSYDNDDGGLGANNGGWRMTACNDRQQSVYFIVVAYPASPKAGEHAHICGKQSRYLPCSNKKKKKTAHISKQAGKSQFMSARLSVGYPNCRKIPQGGTKSVLDR